MEQTRKRCKWENDDYICCGHILNGIYDALFDVYQNVGSAKELWDQLMAEDASSKKFLVSNFNNYKMVDSRSHFRIEKTLRAKEGGKGKGKEMLVLIGKMDNAFAWWIDSGATWHACKDRCWAVVRLSEPKRKFLGEKGIDCMFIGYVEHFKAYRFYVIETNEYISVNSVIESRDAMFDEKRFTSIPRPKSLMPSSSEDHIGESPIETPTTHWSNRARKEAINDEMDSIIKNNTWILSDLPLGCKLLGCKWIFKRKMKVDGTIDKFKARLVIQGFRQKERIDYFDTYAPVARISTIRLLIALAATYNLVIYQMDVKTTFLNGDLEEEVYMKKPEGFIMPENEHKDMEEADVILGIRIKREDKGITITQSHYIEKILKKFKYDDCCRVSTPLDLTIKLMPNTGREYSRSIGCLMYAMTSTRPNIAYVMGKLILEGYSDASWITNSKDHTSTTSWVFLLGGGAISWAFKKQTCITDSTMEAEFIALAAAGKEAEWLRNMIYEIRLWPKPISPISIHCDSATTLAKAYCQIYNGKPRHLGVRHSMVRELITNGMISVEFVRSQQNLADHLTKELARDLVHKSAIGMGLKSIEIFNDETPNSLPANVGN
ncbi:zinc finger, CCHC-type containing protein [Tanacetum coccineum]